MCVCCPSLCIPPFIPVLSSATDSCLQILLPLYVSLFVLFSLPLPDTWATDKHHLQDPTHCHIKWRPNDFVVVSRMVIIKTPIEAKVHAHILTDIHTHKWIQNRFCVFFNSPSHSFTLHLVRMNLPTVFCSLFQKIVFNEQPEQKAHQHSDSYNVTITARVHQSVCWNKKSKKPNWHRKHFGWHWWLVRELWRLTWLVMTVSMSVYIDNALYGAKWSEFEAAKSFTRERESWR